MGRYKQEQFTEDEINRIEEDRGLLPAFWNLKALQTHMDSAEELRTEAKEFLPKIIAGMEKFFTTHDTGNGLSWAISGDYHPDGIFEALAAKVRELPHLCDFAIMEDCGCVGYLDAFISRLDTLTRIADMQQDGTTAFPEDVELDLTVWARDILEEMKGLEADYDELISELKVAAGGKSLQDYIEGKHGTHLQKDKKKSPLDAIAKILETWEKVPECKRKDFMAKLKELRDSFYSEDSPAPSGGN